jgi:hypothetical protein
MNDSLNPETVGTSFLVTGAGATLSRTTCAARASAYRWVLALPVSTWPAWWRWVNPDGRCEILGFDVLMAEDGAGWPVFR